MNIEFYIPKDEKIPTDLRLIVDGVDVIYDRIDGGFRFQILVETDEQALEIAQEITQQMIRDHDDSRHGVSWRTVSLEIIEDSWKWRRIVEWKYRVRDSY